MGQIYAQVTFPHRSLIPADAAMNTFFFTGVDDPEDQATSAFGRLVTFYNVASGSATIPIKNYLSGELLVTGARVKIYNMDDPEPRVPILDESLGLSSPTPVNAVNFPAEVAVGLSYRADPESGVAPARRRGRIYLGPLNTGAGTGSTTATARPTALMQSNCAQACKQLAIASPVGTRWAVHSRVSGTYAIITNGYVDDAYDTQRRRGVDTTSRVGWEVEI